MPLTDSAANSVIDQAREYLGTPFVHQGRQKGAGIDCIGLIVEINKRRGKAYDRTNYGRLPHEGELELGLNQLFIKTDYPPALGDILLFEWPSGRQHVGIHTDVGMIHAYESGRRYGRRAGMVVEHTLGPVWRRLIKAVYTWPDSQ